MLPKIKRSYFKLVTDTQQELSLREGYNGAPSLELATRGSLWIFRYDCIVAVSHPQYAISVCPDGIIELEHFTCE